MAEIIGTAFVRIRAITSGLASEIKDGFDKGVSDARLDDSGSKAGSDFVGGFGDETKGGIPDVLDVSMDKAEADVDFPGRGEKGGRSFAKGFGDGQAKETKRKNPFLPIGNAFDKMLGKLTIPGGKFGILTTLGTPAIGGAAKIITALGGAIVSVLGNVATAALGAGAALGGIAVTAVPALFAVTQALKVESDALDEFHDHMADVSTLWEDFGLAAQENLLPGLEAAADTLTKALLPSMTEFSGQIGTIVGGQVQWAAAALTSADNMEAWQEVLDASTGITGKFGEIIIRLADSLPKLFAAVAPVAQRFADDIARLVEKFQTWINTADREQLTAKFQGWYDRFRLLARVVGNVVTGISNIFNIGAGASDPLMKRLDDLAQRFREFTESRRGRNQIKKFFDEAMPVAREFVGLLTDLAKIVISPVFEGDTKGVLGFLRFLRRDVVPALQEFADSIEGIGLSRDTVQNFVNAFLELTQTAVESGAFTGFIESLTTIIELVSDLVALPTIGPVVGELLKFVGVLKALNLVTGINFGKFAAQFIPALLGIETAATGFGVTVGAALAPLLPVILGIAAAVAFFIVVWKNWDTIVDGLKAGWEWFSKLALPLKIVVGLLGGLAVIALLLASPIVAVAAAIVGLVAIIKNWEAVSHALIAAWQAVLDFFQELPGILGRFFTETLPRFLETAGQAILDFFTNLPSQILSALSELGSVLTTFFSNLPSLLLQGLSALGGLAAQIGSALGGLLLDALSQVPGFAGQFGQFILTNIIRGLSALAGLAARIGSVLLRAFISGAGVLARWAIELPARLFVLIQRGLIAFARIGIEIIGRIIVFLAKALPKLITFFLTLPIKILNAIVEGINKLLPVGFRIISAIVRGLISALPAIVRFFTRLPGQIIGFIGDAGTALFDIGVDLATGILDGIISMGPTILDFFRRLPGQLLNLFLNAAQFLLQVGISILRGLLTGAQNGLGIVLDFFRSLPSTIIGLLSRAGSFLVQAGVALLRGLLNGARSMFGALNDLFAGLPRRILHALGSLGATVGRAFIAMARAVIRIARDFISDIVGFFTKLPGQLFRALGSLLSNIRDRFSTMAEAVRNRVTQFLDNVVDFFTKLPGRLFRALGSLLSQVRDRFVDLADRIKERVSNFIDDVVQFFKDLPTKIFNALLTLTSEAMERFHTLIDTVKEAVGNFIDDVVDFFIALPGRIKDALVNFASDVAGFILDKLKEAVNIAIRGVNALIRLLPSVHIPGTNVDIKVPEIPELALGTIVGRATLAVIGEAGAEAVIPLTRPARALHLMHAAGLDTLVLNNQAGATGDTTLIKIENATFVQPVDLDMLIAKVPHAYNALVGSAAGRG